VRCPTLILWGECETIFMREDQERLLAAMPGAALRVYPQTGHALHWEQPERFVEDVEAFIQGCPGGAVSL
jgi:non-heme chloroperoxidase